MADKKDFLEQFSSAGKPASFQEEERVQIKKEKKPVNKVLIGIIAAALIIIGVIIYFIFFAPKIEMPNFVYQNKSDVVAWVKQQGIETTGIVFDEEYNFDYDEGTVLSQSIKDGTKVKNNVKLNFLLSKGADPDELISVPDLASMTRSEVKDWISTNKLTKTKINAAYNEDIEEDLVINFVFTGCDEYSFTRSSSLKINVSKGPAPAGKITVDDFINKPYANAESWAKNNKVTLSKTESYSDTVEKDYIISQSVDGGKTLNEGESLSVVVSKGKAVYAPNFINLSQEEATRWLSKNGVTAYYDEIYSGSLKGNIISQSVSEGSIITDDITLTVSLGLPDFSGITSYSKLKDKISEVNAKGANISKNRLDDENSDTVPVGDLITTFGKVKVGSTLDVIVSKGKNIWIKDYEEGEPKDYLYWDIAAIYYDEDQIRKLCDYNGLNYQVVYENSETFDAHRVISVTRVLYDANNNEIVENVVHNSYISESEIVTVVVSLGN